VLAQRIARVHRIGQKDSVHAVFLIAEDSFEQRLEVTLAGKRALFSAAVGDDTETKELERMSMARRMATVLGEAGLVHPRCARRPPDYRAPAIHDTHDDDAF